MGYVFLPHHAISSRIIKGINGAILYGVLYILMSADIVRHFLWKSIWNDVSPLGKRLFKVGRSRGWCTKCSSLAEGPYHIALDTILWAKLIWFLELAFPLTSKTSWALHQRKCISRFLFIFSTGYSFQVSASKRMGKVYLFIFRHFSNLISWLILRLTKPDELAQYNTH